MLRKMFISLAGVIAVMAALIFFPAGTLDYWQAWLFLACYFLASLLLSFWLVRHDPALLERRMRGGPFAEGERSQKIIMTLTSLGFVALLVVPGLDRRFGWSGMPAAIAIAGDLPLLAGWFGIFVVFRANSYAAATVQVSAGPKVISTGPYASFATRCTRPRFSCCSESRSRSGPGGAFAWTALLPALAWRLTDEERVLLRDLEGYEDYRRNVRSRLIPFIW
jgi:protein-S-isoprenylcysteine O-methyltransferase Ste14